MNRPIAESADRLSDQPGLRNMKQVLSVQQLLDIPRDELIEGLIVFVSGYREACDGGEKWVIWSDQSTKADNRGTVHDPSGGMLPGRWKVIHNGTGNFRWFGIFNHQVSADNALEAMVNDPEIRRIEAHSDLLFQRRHIFNRSDIDIDFAGYKVYSSGIEEVQGYDPFAAVLFFQGKQTDVQQTVVLSTTLAELTDVFEVADAHAFQIGDWWRAQVNHLDGKAERELDKLFMVTEIIDDKHVRFNYMLGWELSAGRTINYWKVDPVKRSHVRNMVFYGAGKTLTTGSHPVAYEFAVECDTVGIEGHGTFWPLIMRRHCTYYTIKQCRLYSPVEVQMGGTGYLAQQINCLYGHVADCHTSNARHLNDFTGSAYCMVENCHNDGDDLGAFVTHGQYEHDLVYIGNSGLISFANSGPTWGESAKRITVKKHVGTRFIAHRKVTDLTLEDVQVFVKEGLAHSGTIWLNADGVHMKDCTAPAGVTFLQVSSRSKRHNLAQGCSVHFKKDDIAVQPTVVSDIALQDCYLYDVDGCSVEGTGRFVMNNTHITGHSSAKPLQISSPVVSILGGSLHHSGIELTGSVDQKLTIDGGTLIHGTNAESALLINSNRLGTVTWNLGNYCSEAASANTAHIRIEGGRNKYKAMGATFSGGKFTIRDSAFGQGCYLLHTSCIEQGVDRSEMPQSSEIVRCNEGNFVVD